MNKLSLTMSVLSAVAVAVPLFAQPALADKLYKAGELQKATWHKSPISIYVEDNTPRVKYATPAPKDPVYLIPTTLPQAQAAPVVVLPGPGQAGGAGGAIVAPPGFAVVDPNHPSPARFGSNIPAQGMAPAANLPNGNTTNRLAGKMWGAPRGASGTVAAPARTMPAGDGIPKTAVYTPTQSSGIGSGSASSTVKTAVSAELTGRFKLLKK